MGEKLGCDEAQKANEDHTHQLKNNGDVRE
jgi:hypothetical protein